MCHLLLYRYEGGLPLGRKRVGCGWLEKQELKKIFASKRDSGTELSMKLRCMGYPAQTTVLQ